MQYLFTLLLFFFSFLSFGQTPCLDAVANSTGLMGEFIPQCEDDGSYSPMQCWSSTGYCWCVDENGIEISGTSLGPGQGTPDCGGGVDCIDDPDGMLTQYGFSCPELATLGCDADLSDFIDGIGFGISVYEICPESCTDCVQEDGCWEDGELYADGDQYWLNECEFIYCEELGSWSEVIEIEDCGENDCIDDPDDILESYSYQCNDIVGSWFSWGCDDDLSVAIPGAPSGMWTIGDLCPQSCDECDEENVIIEELFNNKKLLKIIDFLGRDINSNTKFQLHIYDDGSIEKKYILK